MRRDARRIRLRDLRCQITNLFPTSVLIIKLKLRLRVDSSGYAPVLSPIKLEKRRDYVGLQGRFINSVRLLNHVMDFGG